MSGTLYVVSTPIGNLEDMTFRAVSVLKGVDLILCEDTRVTRRLLARFDINVPVAAYHQHSTDRQRLSIFDMLIGGKSVALVSDAGTPGISDPGNELIDFILDRNRRDHPIRLVSVPGASSVTASLSLCGFNVKSFGFIGFWPKKGARKMSEKIRELGCPIVFFESPYRILKTLDFLISALGGDRRIFVAQELTKVHERIIRGSLSEVRDKLAGENDELGRVKGEITCVLE